MPTDLKFPTGATKPTLPNLEPLTVDCPTDIVAPDAITAQYANIAKKRFVLLLIIAIRIHYTLSARFRPVNINNLRMH